MRIYGVDVICGGHSGREHLKAIRDHPQPHMLGMALKEIWQVFGREGGGCLQSSQPLVCLDEWRSIASAAWAGI